MSKLHAVGRHPDSPACDVVFVHGLGGDWTATWAMDQARSETYWPSWIADHMPSARVWSLAYEAHRSRWWPGMSVIEHAEQVLELLIINRLGFRPILFVAHSLGGLLVKNLLRASCDALNRNQKRIALSTRGVVFFATPNSGSRLATNLHALLRIAFPLGWVYRPSRLIAELRAHQPELLKLNQWYRDRVANPTGGLHIDTKVYYESYPAAFGLVQIVDAASADPGIPGVRPVPVAADHFDICKFPDRECATYNGTLQFLSECLTKQSGAPPAGQTRRYIELKFPGSVPNDLLVEIDPNPLGNENLTIRITGSRGGVHE